ncbi:hypothetical protein G9A89_005732 [Geosiphon pyriformis]|nr:hypothetical protein G9A89_005732 [Geosiphon pyriformis]
MLASQLAVVLHQRKFSSRIFTLNRPEKHNALNLDMVRNITPQLQAWNESDLCKVIIIKGTGSKAFCAGGDVREVIELAEREKRQYPQRNQSLNALKFFKEEYQLNHLIATLDKPFVAFMNGITMGGGVGLSVHAPFRVATENTVFAMPETQIGFFPDVGGSFFLPRMDGEIGTYLALTGAYLNGYDVFQSGIATHYVPSERLDNLEERLSELESDDYEVINSAIEDFVGDPVNRSYFISGETRKSIDRIFSHNTFENIISALEKENTSWAVETKNKILQMSPTSLKVTLSLMRKGRKLGIADCFQMEYRLAQKFLEKSDFVEGVTARLINKTSPKWNPPSLEEISDKDIEEFYLKSPVLSSLNLLNPRSYERYPFAQFALPSEEEVKKVVTGENRDVGSLALTKPEVLDFFLKDRNGKIGVREKILEILARKTRTLGGSDSLQWDS